ncbi:MAG: VacJ family lipoprotein [Nitrospira sp. SB0672_bin_25]|nr:VacJ family lipoprotein [Nitrospira sp. SB0672_bin_25]
MRSTTKVAMLCVAIGWLAFTVLTGCATTKSTGPEVSDHDPFESVNRKIHRVNDIADSWIAKPVTEPYVSYTPRPIRNSVSNFFDNVAYPSVILNDLLQGKGTQGLDDLGRFLVNTTFGFLGFWDVGTPLGLEAHDEDFGQTLAVWGMDESAYLVLPFIGPSTVRDTPNLGVTTVTNILFYVPNPYVVPVALLGFIDYRAGVDEAVTFRNETAVEPYLFTREAYLQHRRFLIYDGNPPVDDDLLLDDPFNDLDVEEPLQEEPGKPRESSDRNE